MKNTTKAVIAGGVGAVLLLGGAGTIAFWTDEASGGTGVIQSGTLVLDPATTSGTWTIQHATANGTGALTAATTFDAATDQIVPGDVLTYTQPVPVTLAGEAIAADFAGTIGIDATAGGDTEDEALAAALTSTPDLAVVELTGASGDLDLADGTLTGEGTGTVNVTTTITFPWGAEDDYNTAKLGSLDFTVDYTLTQVTDSPNDSAAL